MTSNFETIVLQKLSEIQEKLSDIESRLDSATNFASDLVSDNGLLGSEGLNTIRESFGSLLGQGLTDNSSPSSIEDLVTSLQDFRERLAGIKDVIATSRDQ
jgi:hypothetical protein